MAKVDVDDAMEIVGKYVGMHSSMYRYINHDLRLLAMDQSSGMPCDRPPPGWTCSRGFGHPGSCAATVAELKAASSCPHGVPHRYACEVCDAPGGPDAEDGCDHEGFKGGCARMGHSPETCPRRAATYKPAHGGRTG